MSIMIFYQLLGTIADLLLLGSGNKFLVPYLMGISQILFLMLPTLLLSRFIPLNFQTIFRLKKVPKARILVLSILGLASFQFFLLGFEVVQDAIIPDFLISWYNKIKFTFEQVYLELIGEHTTGNIIRSIFIIAVIPALTEETLFRGFLQRSLEEKLKPFSAIIISGVLFGVIHFNPISAIPLIIIGIYLGVIAYSSETLILPITLHFLNNLFALIVLYFFHDSKLDSSHQINLFTASAIVITGFALTFTAGYWIYKEKVDKNLENNNQTDIFVIK